ncbi:hypothetical protein, partial [Klebsiella pneumoniae]|uniref:hypothetical protein n=1 Tax=Klebsiella pneumoniae TaxID=573 RepID=UPI0027316FFF
SAASDVYKSQPSQKAAGRALRGRIAVLILDSGEIFLAQYRQVLRAVVATQGGERLAQALEPAVDGLQVIEQLTNGWLLYTYPSPRD